MRKSRREVWEPRRDAIQRMVDAHLTDKEIGKECGRSGETISQVRKLLGIPSPYGEGHKRKAAPLSPAEPVAPMVGVEYTDEAGLTVMRYPARYAGGVTPGVTARPKRG